MIPDTQWHFPVKDRQDFWGTKKALWKKHLPERKKYNICM